MKNHDCSQSDRSSSSTLDSEIDLRPPSDARPPTPTFKLLFSFLTPRRKLVLLAPAVLSSIAAGGIAPFMTYAVGQSFNAFAAFPLAPHPSQAAKDALLHGVGRAALQLVALGIAALVMSSITSSLWIWTGEHNVLELRRQVYHAVVHHQMAWFDRQTESDASPQDVAGESAPIGVGGLMATFARGTDDVRAASSLAAGQFIQYLITAVSALVFAFIWSPLLTLVILSAVPFLIIIQGFSQGMASPRLARERTLIAHAASLVSRVASNIGAVKAANADAYERSLLARVAVAVHSLPVVWGVTGATSQFITMAMFVQGFWYGAHLVSQGKNQPGDVMSVFWACLIATSNLQMIVPLMVVLTKGKTAAAEFAIVIASSEQAPVVFKHRRAQALRRITPHTFTGDFALTALTFAYPTRPTLPVLRRVDLFFPSRETTFIVGPSGCGKSTIGSILLGYYTPAKGAVLLDEQDLRYLDVAWVRKHVAGVTQGSAGAGAQVFRGSIHWNVALGAVGSGRCVEDVTRAEVEEACRLAMLEGWVSGLEAGYDTVLVGSGENTDVDVGVVLSGGMRQRLALARARIRDPEVLILDESTSALDPVTRHLTTAAVRAWRSRVKKTTIVITHDLASIHANDFVYVMREGRVAEQGFRADLEAADGEWNSMLLRGGCAVRDASDNTPPVYEEVAEILASQEEDARETKRTKSKSKHYSLAPTLSGVRPVTSAIGGWMSDVVAELTRATTATATATAGGGKSSVQEHVPLLPASPFSSTEFEGGASGRSRRPSSVSVVISSPGAPPPAYGGRWASLQLRPSTVSFTSPFAPPLTPPPPMVEDDDEFESEKMHLKRSAEQAVGRREKRARRAPGDPGAIVSQASPPSATSSVVPESIVAPGLVATLRRVYPTIPAKPLFFLGLLACLLSGAMTPVFSFLLSRLMYQVSANPGADTINACGAFVLGVAAVDGLIMGLKYFLMEMSAIRWVARLRNTAYARVLAQDKAWFDVPAHAPAALVQVLVKDADDARTLVAVVVGQCVVVVTMIGVGLVWAMVWGWQLTLVGIAIGPVFVGVMAMQAGMVAKVEVVNKRAREEVARVYYETILNIRSIRAMSLEPVMQSQFDKAASVCLATGSRGAFVEGCSYGVASALIYLAEAALFYVGAIFVANGTYTYLRMVQVLNLVVFTVTIGSQLMAFTQRIAKSVQATTDLFQMAALAEGGGPCESAGAGVCPPMVRGDLVLSHVSFSYPDRPETVVLDDVSIAVGEGECVALVGASGCGKSTVAALLQRLYVPTGGRIEMGGVDVGRVDVRHVRAHVAVVAQTPNLFDGTIWENIVYGAGEEGLVRGAVERAAREAQVHDAVMALPQGYDTRVGENATRLSGGEAQRVQIARALARPDARLLVLDECTSALDGVNQARVLETLTRGGEGGRRRTTVMVTHKVEVMRACDRVIVMERGRVVEEGPYEVLVGRRGAFAKLAGGGEWLGE